MGQHKKNFIKLLQSASQNKNLWNVFSDFVHMAAICFANSDRFHVVNSKETWETREKQYLEIINSYSKNEQKLFPEMIAELTMDLDEQVKNGQFRDVLGEIFHDLELHNTWKGQFFTPQSVSDLMGHIVMDKDAVKSAIETYGYVSINEPCCGAGSMLFGFLNAFREMGFNHSKEVLIFGQDLDERCVWMTYIQCSLYGVPAVITQQNTLSMKQFGQPWYSPVYFVDGWHWKEKRAHDIQLQEQEYEELLQMLGT